MNLPQLSATASRREDVPDHLLFLDQSSKAKALREKRDAAYYEEHESAAPLLLANLCSLAFDFVARQKVQGQHLNWFVVEQLPVIASSRFEDKIGKTKIADFIRAEVLHLSYTAWDLAPFARDLGYVDQTGEPKPPFTWDEADRRQRIARLDALFMQLYGLSKDDAAYILDTFPIVREHDEREFGHYRTKALVLAYMDLIAASKLEASVDEAGCV
jgi:hypothetical protein